MKRVAVLRGGPSNEYAVSMETGKNVLQTLANLRYRPYDIVITKQGEWLHDGLVRQPQQLLEAMDVVFVALHGEYGEDGQVQRILERSNVPFTGSRSLPSAIAFNKELTKRTLQSHGLKMPRHRRFGREEMDNIAEVVPQIFSDIGTELFVKPVASGSSIGAAFVSTEDQLQATLASLLEQYDQILIEEFIRGQEATVGVLNDFRDESLYTLPAIEIIPSGGNQVFSYEDKYSGQTEEIVPGRFTYPEKSQLSEAAALVHDVIECQNYSRSDFIVKDGEVYFLEVNTLPGLTEQSLFPKAAAAVGLTYPQLIEHLIETARV